MILERHKMLPLPLGNVRLVGIAEYGTLLSYFFRRTDEKVS